MLTTAEIKEFPKVMLHDHLDGGVRIDTLIELAQQIGYEKLPTYDASELQKYILGNSARGKLELYLETFDHTIAVMQTAPALERIAYEFGQDMANDGVIYAESRFAPALFIEGGLSLDEVMLATSAGFERAEKEFGIVIKILACGMKQMEPSTEIAELALRFMDEGNSGGENGSGNYDVKKVVGFDLAGPEEGFLCSKHIEAIEVAREGGLSITLHAGEGAGLDSIKDAVESGAERLGHGVRIIDDIGFGNENDTESGGENDTASGSENSTSDSEIKLRQLSKQIRDQQIPLEVCPTSNIHTGISDAFETHPIAPLFNAGFNITLNTDNRLMSDITLSAEFENCQTAFGWGEAEFRKLTENGIRAAFCSEVEKEALLQRL